MVEKGVAAQREPRLARLGEFALDDGEVIPGWLDYRTDVGGLYLTGSTSHPGGSVSGRPGRNTARTVLEDLGLTPTMSNP